MNTTSHASDAQVQRALIPALAKADWTNSPQVKHVQRAAQIAAVIRLADEPNAKVAEILANAQVSELGEAINALLHAGGWAPLTRTGASNLITWLDSLPRVARQAAPVAAPQANTAPQVGTEGFYLLEGEAYRVVESRRNPGQFFAERARQGGWDYAPGVVYKLTPDMLMDAAAIARFGVRRGFCLQCRHGLKDPVSQRIGLGTQCGPDVLGKAEYRAARKHWVATDATCAEYDRTLKAQAKARREARKARVA